MAGSHAIAVGQIELVDGEDLADQFAVGLIDPAGGAVVFVRQMPAAPAHPATHAAALAFAHAQGLLPRDIGGPEDLEQPPSWPAPNQAEAIPEVERRLAWATQVCVIDGLHLPARDRAVDGQDTVECLR